MPLVNLHHSDESPRPVTADSLVHILRAMPWGFGAHAHDDAHQLLWLNKGAGRVMLDSVVRGLTTNTAVFIPRGTVHEFQLTPISSGWVVTLPCALPAGTELPPDPRILAIPERGDQAGLTAHCDEIHREMTSRALGHSAALACHAGLLTIWLARQLARREAEAPVPSSRQRLAGRFLRLLEENHRAGLGAADYAERLEITPTHLTRVMREATGKPATTHIQDRVLLAACAELAFGRARIAEISTRLGFTSPAYFTRLFTQRIGSAPSAFRRAAAQG